MKYGNAILDPQVSLSASSDIMSHLTSNGLDDVSSIISCHASPVADRNNTKTACGNV